MKSAKVLQYEAKSSFRFHWSMQLLKVHYYSGQFHSWVVGLGA